MNHLIATEYFRIINDMISELCFKEIDIIKIDFNTTTIPSIIEEARYSSLFDEYKNIVVYNANFFGPYKCDEKEIDMLLDYLSNPNPKTCLIFISNDKLDNRKKITKILKDKNCIHDYKKISYYDLVDLTNKYIQRNNWKISKEIVSYIIKSSNNNYDIVCSELDKLMTCFSNSPSFDDAKKLISTSISDSVFKFVDAVVDNDIKESNKILSDLRIYKIDPAVIIVSLAKSFKQILFYKIAQKNNFEIKNVFMKDNLQDWQLKKIADGSNKYTIEKLISIIHIITEYDYRYKSGIQDKDTIINSLLLEFM